MPPVQASMPILPGLAGLTPPVAPWLPGQGIDPATIPEATFRKVMQLAGGDTIDLTAMLVRRTLRGQSVIMYGFNGQYPGPLIEVSQDATIYVRFTNELDLPTTIHWHGVRVDNRFDGVPDVTQAPVQPGGAFLYQVRLPDAGIY